VCGSAPVKECGGYSMKQEEQRVCVFFSRKWDNEENGLQEYTLGKKKMDSIGSDLAQFRKIQKRCKPKTAVQIVICPKFHFY
jgi:hypothetical protein